MPQLERVNLDFAERAEVTVSTNIDLPLDVATIWQAIVDNSTWRHWFAGTRRVDATPAVWSAAGDTRTIVVGPLKIEEVALEITENERWAMCITMTNVTMAKRLIEVLDLRDSSRDGETRTELTWTMSADLHPITKPLRPIIESQFAKKWATSFENLFEYLSESS